MFLAKVLHHLQLAGELQHQQSVEATPTWGSGREGPGTVDKASAFEELAMMSSLSDEEGEGEGEGRGIRQERDGGGGRVKDLKWLIWRMSRLASYEAGHHPKESIKVKLD